MKKLLVVCGPTAVGKTSLGLKLAKKFNGEVVSADSRQVYQGMDVGTGKEIFGLPFTTRKFLENFQIGFYQKEGVKFWLYDIVEPTYRFNVADYVKCANLVIKDVWERKRLPILVGGTGFYIKAVIDGIETIGIGPNWELRNKLSGYSLDELQIELRKSDPQKFETMNESDRTNPRRLIRAIELALKNQGSHQPIPGSGGRARTKDLDDSQKLKIGNCLITGLKMVFCKLYQKIDERVNERVKMGMGGEIKDLLKRGCNFENSALGTTIGYKEWESYFERGEELEKIVERWKLDEHGYARRQMTWFKKDRRINWFDIMGKDYLKRIESLVRKWYYKS